MIVCFVCEEEDEEGGETIESSEDTEDRAPGLGAFHDVARESRAEERSDEKCGAPDVDHSGPIRWCIHVMDNR